MLVSALLTSDAASIFYYESFTIILLKCEMMRIKKKKIKSFQSRHVIVLPDNGVFRPWGTWEASARLTLRVSNTAAERPGLQRSWHPGAKFVC